MFGPGDETATAAARRGHLRASHADREEAVGILKTAFVQGRLTREEFDARIGQALAARTLADVAALSADIPAGITPAAPQPQPQRRQMSNAARWGVSGFPTPAILAVGYALASQPRVGGYGALVFAIAFIYFVRWLAVGADLLWEWHCVSVPGAATCVRCGHSAAPHRTAGSCTARQGSLAGRGRCACTGYVPPGISPHSADLRLEPS
jgi:hypothetical protein